MTRAEIQDKVQEKLDEVSQFDQFQIDSVAFIDKFMDLAAEKVLRLVPLHLIPPTSFASQTQVQNADGSGLIKTPLDYLRLHSLKLNEWDRAVLKAHSKEENIYNWQKNNVTRGKPSKPMVFFGYDGTLKACLEYYSVVTSHTIEYAFYIPKVDADTAFPENLVDVLSWQCAADILQVVGSDKAMSYCTQQVQQFIQDNSLKI